MTRGRRNKEMGEEKMSWFCLLPLTAILFLLGAASSSSSSTACAAAPAFQQAARVEHFRLQRQKQQQQQQQRRRHTTNPHLISSPQRRKQRQQQHEFTEVGKPEMTTSSSLFASNDGSGGGHGMMMSPPFPVRVAVLGGGNFGLALATICARQGIPTTILVRSEEVADHINTERKHPRYMKDWELPSKIRATTKPEDCLPDATYIVHAVPVQYSREFLMSVRDHIPPGTPVLSGSKGIETTSLGFMADILKECLGEERPYAFLSGPSFAREMCQGVATAVVIASEDLLLARDLADLLSDDSFRAFTTRDVVGVEIGGAVKNVVALAAGMCEGLGLGTNAMSGLVTRGCGEMRRLGLSLGAKSTTISGLSGVGDTFGTCFGPLSRNRKFGYRLGQGETMEEILESSTEVAEGVDTSRALVKLIKTRLKGYRLDLKYPILFGVASILEGNLTPLEGLKGIMNMPFQMESFEERY